MSPEHLAVLMFAGVLTLVLVGVPLYLCLGSLGLIFGILGHWAPMVFDQFICRVYGVMSNEVLPAVPLFIFMGAVLTQSGAAEKLFNALYRVLGALRGGLAICTIVICTIFAATAGVVGATETAVGLMALPAMLNRKYHIPLAAGAICAGGTLGIIIPPSVMLLVYGPMAGLSVAKMFIAALIPGLVLAGLYILYIAIVCIIKPGYGPPISKEERAEVPMGKVIGEVLIYMIPPLFLIFAVLGTIALGIASPTEAAAVGALGSVLVAAAYRRFSWKTLFDAAVQTLRITSMIMFITIGAFMFTGVFTALNGGKFVGELVLGLPLSKWGILVIMQLALVFLGMFIDWMGILFITIPIFVPVAIALGFDPLWYGTLVCVNLQISFLSPPFAYSMFYLKGIAPPEVTMGHIYRGVVPFVGLQIVALALCVIFPQLILWLPSKMM